VASPARTPKAPAKKRNGRPPRTALLRRWLALAAVFLFAYLYWQPLTTYLDRRAEVERASATVESLEQRHRQLERELAVQRSDAALVREARRLGFVRPGERLYIVKGIPEWRRAQRARSSVGADG
jgi:cell division protein FtsB